jgi:hypothetical protein
MSEEKRKFIRFECVIPIELVEIEGTTGTEAEALIEDISREGLRLILDLGLDFGPGRDLCFQMYNPDMKKTCLVTGEIIWAKSKGNKVEIGLKIKTMEKCTKSELLDLGYTQWRKHRNEASAAKS